MQPSEMTERKYQEFLCNLNVPYAQRKVALFQKSRAPGTCEGILKRSEYLDWLEGDASKLLHVTGPPGSGKSTMFGFLIEKLELKRKHHSFARPTTVTYHACGSSPPLEIVRVLLFHLLEDKPETFKFIQQHFETHGTNLFGDFQTLWKIFCHIVEHPTLGKVFVLLDGLDECEGGREFFSALRDQFLRLQSSGNATMKLFVTYRPGTEPEVVLKDVGRHLRIDATINNDLNRFIEWKLQDLSKQQHLPVDLKSQLREILTKPDNTFIWVSLVLEEISRLPKNALAGQIHYLPRELHNLYDMILSRIDPMGGDYRLSALQWIVCAQRTLKFDELAIALTPTWDELETGTRPPAHVVQALEGFLMSYRSLIHVNPVSKTVALVHSSLRDFLLKRQHRVYSISYDATNLHILDTCLRYLSREEFKSIPTHVHRNTTNYRPFNRKAALQDHLLAHPFLEYAALQWPAHAHAASSKLALRKWDYDFFGENAKSLNAWVQIYWAFKRPFDDPPEFTALHVAGLLGLDALLNWLLEKNPPAVTFDIDKKDTTGSTALHWATRNGHMGTVRMLIDQGAAIDVTDNEERTPLAGAATNGHDMIVGVLLAHGATVDFPSTSPTTPIHLAARNGKATVLKLFEAVSGAGLDTRDKKGRTPLSWAAMHGRLFAVKTLLELGANVHSVDSEHTRTALHWAVVGGCEAASRQSLLDDGVDIHMDLDDEGQDDLDSRNYSKVVRVLYEAGADLNARDTTQSISLHYATEMQHQDLQSLLIKLGSDVDMKNAQNKSSAQLAWDRKRLDWSLYKQDQELTSELSEAGNSEVAVLRRINDIFDGPEIIFRKTPKTVVVKNMRRKKQMQEVKKIRERLQACFLREHKILQKINHPNIVSYLGYDEDPETKTCSLYLEFCNARDLSDYETWGNGHMDASCPQGSIPNEQCGASEEGSASGVEDAVLQESEVWSFIFLLAAAIAYCHHGLSMRHVRNLDEAEFGFEPDWSCILHRDIKPRNIALHIQSDGTRIPKLCDLGLSKQLIPEMDTNTDDKPRTVKSDIYSFGATFNNLDIAAWSTELESLLEACLSSEGSDRPSSFCILQIAWGHISADLRRRYSSLPELLGSRFLLGAFEVIAGQLDSENGLETRLARQQREKLLKRLGWLSRDGAIELFRKHGKSLHLAVLLGEDAKVQELLRDATEASVNKGWGKSGWTPLHLAAQNDNLGIVEMLLKSGADKGAIDEFGHVPYYYASNGGYKWMDIIAHSAN
ncbi:uncharacterized protein FPRO_07403 [Fusarium proliferatum ET1]|uniref:Protein kinase domain-containing protein n=1 Tax=Fusarium proliferatum (strain ET1) TaxID=1227346 RepID=A0A1L7VUS6_FUSPR|nr:uncharacterized protein FPRO_07403 [Fusarium proliferatum ET1]CZR43680.1 uncharacterized protein FPRO_07403 [Fusarium proliferatum ET1]